MAVTEHTFMDLSDLLENLNVIDARGNVTPANVIMRNSQYIIYLFSASWCLPCVKILPVLRNIYQESIDRDLYIQIIYISHDDDEEVMMKHFLKEHGPWYTIPFGNVATEYIELKLRFGVTHIPFIAVLNKDGIIITTNGKREIDEYGVNVLTIWTK
ncbi:hypothetical protein FQR65_LT00712 [Abscondita terminalis]|nr:hypothetical protein FQR65_LT00712 [Abscondita terminalis]